MKICEEKVMEKWKKNQFGGVWVVSAKVGKLAKEMIFDLF